MRPPRCLPTADRTFTTMDTNALLLAGTAVVFTALAVHAWRRGHGRRDVLMMTGMGAAFCAGAAVAAAF